MKGDTISRSALKKMLVQHYGEDDRSYDAAIALTAVQQAPTVASAPEWISVKDRLPEEGERVITWHDKEDGRTGFMGMRYNVLDYFDDVTHWLPLPEPPKMDGGEGE